MSITRYDPFREMLTLAYRLDLRGKGGAAHNRIGRLYRDTGSLEEASRHLSTAMVLFEAAGDPTAKRNAGAY